MTRRTYDVAVVGGGIGGLAAAAALAAHRHVVLVQGRLRDMGSGPRVDSVPARFLAWLAEVDIDPRAVGVDRIHDDCVVAWEDARPLRKPRSACAHVRRDLLAQALHASMMRARNRPDEAVGTVRPDGRGGWVGEGWRAKHVVDASGRAAVFAAAVVRPSKPWVAQTYACSGGTRTADNALRIAALPAGYAYRQGTADTLCLGLVGRAPLVGASASSTWRYMLRHGAGFMLEGFDPSGLHPCGRAQAAAVQWSTAGGALPVGDSALARDPLSSQGIASAVSDAMYAVAAIDRDDATGLAYRHRAQCAAHLKSLAALLSSSRHADAPAWRAYRAFVATHADGITASVDVALRDGNIEAIA